MFFRQHMRDIDALSELCWPSQCCQGDTSAVYQLEVYPLLQYKTPALSLLGAALPRKKGIEPGL